MSRFCVNSPGFLFYLRFIFSKESKKRITPLITKCYREYFGLDIRNQDKYWVPHMCCYSCHKNFTNWFNGKPTKMPFGQPTIWREPRDHVSQSRSQSQNTLFNLGMVTNSYERQDIIQFALKRLPGG
jgi:hypothetical protein